MNLARVLNGLFYALYKSPMFCYEPPCVTRMFLCNSMPRLVAWIQISLNSCDRPWQQNFAHTFSPLVWHACVTHYWDNCYINQSWAFPTTPSWSVTCYSECFVILSQGQVASRDRTFRVTGQYFNREMDNWPTKCLFVYGVDDFPGIITAPENKAFLAKSSICGRHQILFKKVFKCILAAGCLHIIKENVYVHIVERPSLNN